MAIDYTQKMPNNVSLSDDKQLQRALETDPSNPLVESALAELAAARVES